jgi:hypothetical protein
MIFESGNGSGTWQTGYRQDYNSGGIRCGFYNATPVAQPVASIPKALVSLGLQTQPTETTSTPSGTTQTITLDTAGHQTLSLASASGNVTVTLTVPTCGPCAGTIITVQHATTPREITVAASSGTVKWAGTKPLWASDAVSTMRISSWRWNGTDIYLAPTDLVA